MHKELPEKFTKHHSKLNSKLTHIHTHTHTHLMALFSGTTRVSRYQKGETNTEARDSEWQWHQLGHMQVCTSLQTDNHPSTPPLSFLQAGCPSCQPTNSIKALKAQKHKILLSHKTARVCNGLPSDVITSPLLIAFKRLLNTLLFSRSFDL